MKKLLYICPHLSTGGQPQYTYKQIQHFIKDFIIEVVEINPSGGNSFVVQKNKIKKIVNLHVLQEDKLNLINIIDKFQPDIIHFQEIPEYNLPLNLLDKIFNQDRKYFIVVTTHGSKTDPSKIVYQPDKYVLVSEWSKKKFEQANLEIPIEVWEYPIEQYSFDKNLAQKYLNLDESYKHVLMVGLFTSGKNQGEIFSIARQLEKYKIKFHFVGNQADNHKDYWSPLMKDKPSNCIVWGERDDVDKFYQACDLFYFSSKLELNPLSIKEAISYKIPCIFRKLETYLNTYDNHELVTYIDDNLKNTKRIILEKLNPEFYEIPGWFSYANLYDKIIEKLPESANAVELGTWLGKSTNYFASKIKKSGKRINFTAIDTFKGTQNENFYKSTLESFGGDVFYDFIDNTVLSDNYNTFEVIKDTSKNAANQFGNSSVDFLMIDASHDYESVKSDLNIWYNKIKPGGYIAGDDYGIDAFPGVAKAVNNFFYNQVQSEFRSFLRKKPLIEIKHLLTTNTDMREMVSVQSIKQLQKYGIFYQQIYNEVYNELPPSKNCRRPHHISKDNKPGALNNGSDLGWITGRHYGCYLAHKNALENINENFDYTLIFEGDAFIFTGVEDFADVINKACFISERDDVYYISFANNFSLEKNKVDDLFAKTAHNQILTHAYLVPNRNKKWWIDRINDCEWDSADLWFNHIFCHHKKNRYTTNRIYSKQIEGVSLLDLTFKS